MKSTGILPTFLDYTIDTLDVEYHRGFTLSETNQLTAGVGYRRVQSEMDGVDPTFEDFDPHDFTNDIFRG